MCFRSSSSDPAVGTCLELCPGSGRRTFLHATRSCLRRRAAVPAPTASFPAERSMPRLRPSLPSRGNAAPPPHRLPTHGTLRAATTTLAPPCGNVVPLLRGHGPDARPPRAGARPGCKASHCAAPPRPHPDSSGLSRTSRRPAPGTADACMRPCTGSVATHPAASIYAGAGAVSCLETTLPDSRATRPSPVSRSHFLSSRDIKIIFNILFLHKFQLWLS